MPTSMRMGAIEWGLLLALAVLWGSSFFFNAIAITGLPPLTVVLGRVGIAALALLTLVWVRVGRMPIEPRTWLAFLIMSALNNVVPFTLIVWGQTRIGSGLASILNATTPLWTVLLADRLIGDERLTVPRLAGVVVGLLGVIVIIGPEALSGAGADLTAQVAVLAAAVSYALAGIFGRRFRAMGITPLVTATGQVTATTLVMLPLVLVIDRPWLLAAPSWEAAGAVASLAILCTALAYVLYFRILATAGATNLLLVTFLIPVVALVLGCAVLSERLEPSQVAGMALIVLGLATIDGRMMRVIAWFAPSRRPRAQRSPNTDQPVALTRRSKASEPRSEFPV